MTYHLGNICVSESEGKETRRQQTTFELETTDVVGNSFKFDSPCRSHVHCSLLKGKRNVNSLTQFSLLDFNFSISFGLLLIFLSHQKEMTTCNPRSPSTRLQLFPLCSCLIEISWLHDRLFYVLATFSLSADFHVVMKRKLNHESLKPKHIASKSSVSLRFEQNSHHERMREWISLRQGEKIELMRTDEGEKRRKDRPISTPFHFMIESTCHDDSLPPPAFFFSSLCVFISTSLLVN